MPSKTDKMSLKAFWEAVEHKLAAYSADELRSILRAFAQETLPSGRQTFLGKLKPTAGTATAAQYAMGQEDLPADIDDLASELQVEMKHAEPWEDYDEWYEYGEYHDEEDSLGPYEQFTEPLAALFDRAEAVFDYGDMALARQAYQKLFEVFGLQDDYGRGVQAGDLTDVDIDEAAARYLRAVYESESLKRRPKAMFEQMQQMPRWLMRPRSTLDDIVQISTQPLPDQDQFFAGWIAFLRKQSGPDADAWLREAIRTSQGAAGLEELARAEGKKRPRAYLDWFTALEEEGKHREVLAAAQEALQTLPAKLPIRAAIADHLCAAAAKLGQTDALRDGRWEAFTVKPTLERLLDLWEIAPAGKEQAKLMQQAAQHLQDYIAHPPRSRDTIDAGWSEDDIEEPAWINKSVLAHAYLLAGEWETARQLAAREQVLGWSSSDNTQGLVVPFCLVLLSGKQPNALPASLAGLWQQRLQTSAGGSYWDEESEPEGDIFKRLERAYAELLARASLSGERQKETVAWSLDVANRRADAIVGGQHRGSYGKAAILIAACAEMLRLRGKAKEAEAIIDDVRNRFPRHRAFQSEMDMAIGQIGRSSKRRK